jgi:hypothetical protein
MTYKELAFPYGAHLEALILDHLSPPPAKCVEAALGHASADRRGMSSRKISAAMEAEERGRGCWVAEAVGHGGLVGLSVRCLGWAIALFL